MVADWTSGRDWSMMATGVTNQLIRITMKSEWKKTVGAENLVSTVFTKREWGRATAVMKKQGLFVLLEVIFDVLQ